jgi:DNA-binding IclR family transcriptional regulator
MARHAEVVTGRVADAAPTDLIQSVSRALRILEEVARSPRPLPVKVIARRCRLNVSTAYHLTRTLCYEGYLVRQADGGYIIGSEVAARFHEVTGSLRRPPRARTVLQHLADVTGHTAYLASFSADRLLIIDLAEGGRSPWLEDLQVGLEAATHATALGKALLATMDGRVRRRVLAAHGMRPFTRCTPVEPDQVEDELVRLRPGDLVREYGQFRDQVCCASMAIPGPRRDSWWALGASARGLSLPSPLLTELRLAATDLAASAEHATGA